MSTFTIRKVYAVQKPIDAIGIILLILMLTAVTARLLIPVREPAYAKEPTLTEPTQLVWDDTPQRVRKIKLPKPKPVLLLPNPLKLAFGKPKDKYQMLEAACNGDKKCVCINNAIFKHDSSWATAGVGKKTNSPGNMRVPRTWKPSVPMGVYKSPGNGVFARFNTLEDGIKANVELYQRNYAHLDAATLVSRWTDGGGNRHYRDAVTNCF